MRVGPFTPRSLSDAETLSYDLFISACGYERRARAIAEIVTVTGVGAALVFQDHQELTFDENLAFYEERGFEQLAGDTEAFGADIERLLVELSSRCSGDRPLRVGLDVSSMTRRRIAMALAALADHKLHVDLEVDVLYTPAKPPSEPSGDGTAFVSGPVLPRFAGWSPFPSRRVVAFVGLGYEAERTFGALEYLEPETVWAFAPSGEDPTYDATMDQVNQSLWDKDGTRLVSYQVQPRVEYRVDNPFGLFVTLESLVSDSLRAGRAIIVPLGPKIFAAASIAVALRHSEVAVWRISSGGAEKPQQRETAGKLVGFRIDVPARRPGDED